MAKSREQVIQQVQKNQQTADQRAQQARIAAEVAMRQAEQRDANK